MFFCRLFWLLLGLLLACAPVRAAQPSIVVVTSERSASYDEVISALGDKLAQGGYSAADLAILTPDELRKQAGLLPRLWIALGTAAAQILLNSESKAPQLHLLQTRHSFLQISTRHRQYSPVSAIFLDQPITRQLHLLRLAFPERKRIGLLLGPVSQMQEPAFRNAATDLGLSLDSSLVERGESLYPSLQRLLDGSDVLLAVADPAVYNANTLQNILLSTFRMRVPVVAFSPAYVKAGALLALYSTPAQIGNQAGKVALTVLQGSPLPAPQYPADFMVSVNAHVTRALGLSLNEVELTARLRRIDMAP
ncbi:MAG: hypothetical protein NT159_14830 [Proteobacteria bacterium]|nr:hypothetical protein [Pseudomonadota bacterium]